MAREAGSRAFIDSMTPAERRDPGLIDSSRRRRIAAGSSAEPDDVSSLVKQFDQMKRVIKRTERWRER
jgi:signal recognition particle subunit SRP54